MALVDTKPVNCVELSKHLFDPDISSLRSDLTLHIDGIAVALSSTIGSHVFNSSMPVDPEGEGALILCLFDGSVSPHDPGTLVNDPLDPKLKSPVCSL